MESQNSLQPAPATATPVANFQGAKENPEKSYLVALALSYFLGSLGADRFYLGRMGSGIAKLLTFGGLGIWHLVDLLLVAFNKLRAADDDRPLSGFAANRSWVRIVAIVMIIFNLAVVTAWVLIMVFVTMHGLKQRADLQADYQTYQNAQYVAGGINQYVAANNAVPEDMKAGAPQADITNLSYHKDSADSYTFCAVYKVAGTGENSPASDYTTPDSLNIPPAHKAGKNCQTIHAALNAGAPQVRTTVLKGGAAATGCGVTGLADIAGTSGSIQKLGPTVLSADGKPSFTLSLPSRGGGLVYTVSEMTIVADGQCNSLQPSQLAVGDNVTVFVRPAAGSSVTGQAIPAAVIIRRAQ